VSATGRTYRKLGTTCSSSMLPSWTATACFGGRAEAAAPEAFEHRAACWSWTTRARRRLSTQRRQPLDRRDGRVSSIVIANHPAASLSPRRQRRPSSSSRGAALWRVSEFRGRAYGEKPLTLIGYLGLGPPERMTSECYTHARDGWRCLRLQMDMPEVSRRVCPGHPGARRRSLREGREGVGGEAQTQKEPLGGHREEAPARAPGLTGRSVTEQAHGR